MKEFSSKRSSLRYVLPFVAFALLVAPLSAQISTRPDPHQSEIEDFIRNRSYESWAHTPVHLSGAQHDGVFYTSHQFVEIYYSPEVENWLKSDRKGAVPDNSMVVALEYSSGSTPGRLERAHARVKRRNASHDGWYWSTTDFVKPHESRGGFGRSDCLACHSAADNSELIFLTSVAQQLPAWSPDADLIWPSPPQTVPNRRLPNPLPEADAELLAYFGIPDVLREDVVKFPPRSVDQVAAGYHAGVLKSHQETFVTSNQCSTCHDASQLLSNSRPNLWSRDRLTGVYANYSPFAEWSVSLNALAARDPVWHAAVETERILRPHLADFTDNACFSCHGPMGVRQLGLDTGNSSRLFTIDMFYASGASPLAKYGALARDGVSCTTCHNVSAKGLGKDPVFEFFEDGRTKNLPAQKLNTYTAQFEIDQPITMWGPFGEDPSQLHAETMKQALGFGAAYGKQMTESRHCGSCHTVLVPAIPVGYSGTDPQNDPNLHLTYEQTTYWEWRNSIFQDEKEPVGGDARTCQSCHMASHRPGRQRIASIYSNRFPPIPASLPREQITLAKQAPYRRHVLLGINLFVFRMYQEFPEILGSSLPHTLAPAQALNSYLLAEDWITHHARTAVADVEFVGAPREVDDSLRFDLRVQNYTGHKFPTGAGFRRAFLEVQVLGKPSEVSGERQVLWVSGRTNRFGALLGSKGKELESEFTLDPSLSQPHHKVISKPEQVQIYETRALDSEGQLQTTVLGIFQEYKDNRILPIGWDPSNKADHRNIHATHPRLPGYVDDPDYMDPETAREGADVVGYAIPLDAIGEWEVIEARLFYQTIPPYYLRDRFRTGRDKQGNLGRDTSRLAHIVSRLNLDGPGKHWKLQIGEGPTTHLKGEPVRKLPSIPERMLMIKSMYYEED